MDSFLEGPHSDELDKIEHEYHNPCFDDFDMDEFNTCYKDGVDDRSMEDDVPF
jgi:hypothetical protein